MHDPMSVLQMHDGRDRHPTRRTFFESLTMDWTFTADSAETDSRPGAGKTGGQDPVVQVCGIAKPLANSE